MCEYFELENVDLHVPCPDVVCQDKLNIGPRFFGGRLGLTGPRLFYGYAIGDYYVGYRPFILPLDDLKRFDEASLLKKLLGVRVNSHTIVRTANGFLDAYTDKKYLVSIGDIIVSRADERAERGYMPFSVIRGKTYQKIKDLSRPKDRCLILASR